MFVVSRPHHGPAPDCVHFLSHLHCCSHHRRRLHTTEYVTARVELQPFHLHIIAKSPKDSCIVSALLDTRRLCCSARHHSSRRWKQTHVGRNPATYCACSLTGGHQSSNILVCVSCLSFLCKPPCAPLTLTSSSTSRRCHPHPTSQLYMHPSDLVHADPAEVKGVCLWSRHITHLGLQGPGCDCAPLPHCG
jgi:hypothetical protein